MTVCFSIISRYRSTMLKRDPNSPAPFPKLSPSRKVLFSPLQTHLALPTRRYRNLASPKWSTRRATTILQIIQMEVSPFPQQTQVLGSPFHLPRSRTAFRCCDDAVTMPSWQNRDCCGQLGQTLPRLRKEPQRVCSGTGASN